MTDPVVSVGALQLLGDRLALVNALEDVVDTTLLALEELLGHRSAMLLVHEPERDQLVTLASRGFGAAGTGSEVALGQGFIGMAGARRRPMRIGNLQRMLSYARTVQRTASLDGATDVEISLPRLPDAGSQMAAPLIARGVLLGVIAVESPDALAYDELDERVFAVAAHLVAAALEREQLAVADPEPMSSAATVVPVELAPAPPPSADAPVTLRHYAVDGSTFLDDDYVIKGVAGRLLWKLVAEHAATGRTSFTNREAKLDPVLELPVYRDNFESRLILLKRRLSERHAPIRLTSSGRGRFELEVSGPLVLVSVPAPRR